MRVLLVGPAWARTRIRAHLIEAAIQIVAEFPTQAAARASGLPADAVVSAPDDVREDGDFDALVDEAVQEPLTPREIEVIELLADGLPNKIIADRLGISDQTVKFHVSSIIGKLGAANRTDAVRRAARRGLISL